TKVREELEKNGLREGDYCVIIYSSSAYHGGRRVSSIFKNVDEFEKRGAELIEKIDCMFDVLFEL
ncbi:MAG TPA: hypothetical protein VN922_15620, partial [Bacteroidia bacterium]|nr:hypothetical protein [Bacteroidia bacterium]